MKLNGEQMTLEKSMSLADFLAQKGYETSRIAVERNGDIVPKASFGDVLLQDDDVLEVVSFVGGG